jgi:lysozyme
MGGSMAMWSHIRTWLNAVERRCGVKPILYVNQRFVNKYLPDAPDIKRNYKIWIARYGEYKPDVKLVVWQLSPDGRVNGITGEVDINVFNGYQTQFDEFLSKECIK